MDPKASRETLDHSIMYIFAVALAGRGLAPRRELRPERAARADTVALWHKIATLEDPEWTRRYHSTRPESARLRCARRGDHAGWQPDRGRDGGRDAHPLGARPFGRADYIRKFQTLTEGIISTRESNRFLEAIQDLPRLACRGAAPAERGASGRDAAGRQAGDLSERRRERTNNEEREVERVPVNRPKKSVALSGVTAGNTALCTVGRTGNDLHYRGYDILDVAEQCEFEEIAHLLVHGSLPTATELAAYKTKLRSMRGLPARLKRTMESMPAAAHPMDVMRTGVSALGCVLPEKDDHGIAGARDIADRLMASLGSMLLYWHHYAHNGRRIEVETEDDSIGGHFLHLLHGKPPSPLWVRAMHTSLILYAEHEFNASTFAARVIAGTATDVYSAITGAIGALRGPKHGGANEVAFEIQQSLRQPRRGRGRHPQAGRGQGGGDRVSATPCTPLPTRGTKSSSRSPVALSVEGGLHEAVRHRQSDRGGDGRCQAHVRQSRLVQRGELRGDGRTDRRCSPLFSCWRVPPAGARTSSSSG